jgi:3-hydroxyacyl-CoA dehydrogenase
VNNVVGRRVEDENDRPEFRDMTESQAERYAFFAERAAGEIPDVPSETPVLPVDAIGIIGAGTMGGGIAMNFLNAGLPVTLVEMNQSALDRGLATIRRNYENSAKRGRLTLAQVEERMALLRPTLDFDLLAEADLVIEAVYEEMAVKKDIFGRLDTIARPDALLATNTSFLDIDQIAAATQRPDHVIGMHFFSPANVMRLLEVVRGERTSAEAIATVMQLAKRIGKAPVLSRVCHGFIANRLMSPRGRQGDTLITEGPTPADVDRALHDFGFAMGQFQMMDLVGLDVIGRGSTERSLSGDLVARGRLGQKQGGGFYDYDEQRRPVPSPGAAEVIDDFARYKGAGRRPPMTDAEIVAWMLYPVVNEGAKILEEGVALRASDIDVAAMLGYNWPIHTGGPMFWADTVGLGEIVSTLKRWQADYGDFYTPAPLLEKLAAEGGALIRV